jgi:Ala-tRNA(Pro) deacylase
MNRSRPTAFGNSISTLALNRITSRPRSLILRATTILQSAAQGWRVDCCEITRICRGRNRSAVVDSTRITELREFWGRNVNGDWFRAAVCRTFVVTLDGVRPGPGLVANLVPRNETSGLLVISGFAQRSQRFEGNLLARRVQLPGVAAVEHILPAEMAKTVVLKADERLILAVLPADHAINMEVLKKLAGCTKLALASENEFRGRFAPFLTGAMPPFGRLFGLEVFCDAALSEQPEIEFNGGTHTDTIRMRFSEFAELETPVVAFFSRKSTGKPMARAA